MSETMFQKELIEFGLPPEIIDCFRDQNYKSLRNIQKKALERGLLEDHSIFVVSPSGSGKTFIGQISALNSIFRHHTKSIYLVPLRALANEKYFQFRYKQDNL